jgi:hypothetical protein
MLPGRNEKVDQFRNEDGKKQNARKPYRQW